jgi:hypothetical protein
VTEKRSQSFIFCEGARNADEPERNIAPSAAHKHASPHLALYNFFSIVMLE